LNEYFHFSGRSNIENILVNTHSKLCTREQIDVIGKKEISHYHLKMYAVIQWHDMLSLFIGTTFPMEGAFQRSRKKKKKSRM